MGSSSTATADTDWRKLFRAVFERSLNPIMLLDQRRVILDANKSAVELLGYTRAELAGRPIDSLIHGPAPSEVRREWRSLMSSGELSGTRVFVRADGSETEVEFAARLTGFHEGAAVVSVVLPLGRVVFGRPVGRAENPELTKRECEIVTLIALGLETGAIAKQLYISPATVRTHVKNAMAKLDVHTRAQLVAVAMGGGFGLEESCVTAKLPQAPSPAARPPAARSPRARASGAR